MGTPARWARTFGLTRALCVLLLLALVPLRVLLLSSTSAGKWCSGTNCRLIARR
jgi:hypothetical protein